MLKTASYSAGNFFLCVALCVGRCPRSTDLHNNVPLDRSTSRIEGPWMKAVHILPSSGENWFYSFLGHCCGRNRL